MVAIAPADLILRYSVVTGSAGNTQAGTAAGSLGNKVSTTAPADNSLNNWFGDYSAADNAAGIVRYRGLFILNNHATDPWNAPGVYVGTETPLGVATALSVDTTGATAKGSAGAQAKTIANETTAPATQTFSAPTTALTALSLGASLPAGQVILVWVRLTGLNSIAVMPDNIPLAFTGTT